MNEEAPNGALLTIVVPSTALSAGMEEAPLQSNAAGADAEDVNSLEAKWHHYLKQMPGRDRHDERQVSAVPGCWALSGELGACRTILLSIYSRIAPGSSVKIACRPTLPLHTRTSAWAAAAACSCKDTGGISSSCTAAAHGGSCCSSSELLESS